MYAILCEMWGWDYHIPLACRWLGQARVDPERNTKGNSQLFQVVVLRATKKIDTFDELNRIR